ncbi:MAG: CotH kinase family protein [Muribaculaceae bacterium]|nr:CotH kinase family protein [Muribaculaceae bacterium]
MKKIILLQALIIAGISAIAAQTPWMHIYSTDTLGITRVKSFNPEKIDSIKHIPDECGMYGALAVHSDNETVDTLQMGTMAKCHFAPQVPIVTINIKDGAEVTSKKDYLDATISVEGNGFCDDFEETAVQIRGRGNTTWYLPKKPYRLKFSKKQNFGGLPAKAKSFVLIANFLDQTLMRNTVAFKIADMLGLPYTNHSVPVELVVNGTYRGSYMLSEKIGINGGSVDIDEDEGVLLELDTNYDEDYKFRTEQFNLPVMIKDPDLAEIVEADTTGTLDTDSLVRYWKADFSRFTDALAGVSGEDWAEYVDLESAVKYVFVFSLTLNFEINQPKSVYMYKPSAADKYYFGPVWDFDWAYNFSSVGDDPDRYVAQLASPTSYTYALTRTPAFKKAFRLLVNDFYNNRMEELMDYIDEYASFIAPSAYHNGELWPKGCFETASYRNLESSERFYEHVEILKTFLRNRIERMYSTQSNGL